jgi:hypothetical protein
MDPDSLDDTTSDDMASLELTSSNLTHPTSNILPSNDQTSDDVTAAQLTSSDPIDPDGTISEREVAGPELARNGYNHNGKFSYILDIDYANQMPQLQSTTSMTCTRSCTSEQTSSRNSTPSSRSTTTKTKLSKQHSRQTPSKESKMWLRGFWRSMGSLCGS